MPWVRYRLVPGIPLVPNLYPFLRNPVHNRPNPHRLHLPARQATRQSLGLTLINFHPTFYSKYCLISPTALGQLCIYIRNCIENVVEEEVFWKFLECGISDWVSCWVIIGVIFSWGCIFLDYERYDGTAMYHILSILKILLGMRIV